MSLDRLIQLGDSIEQKTGTIVGGSEPTSSAIFKQQGLFGERMTERSFLRLDGFTRADRIQMTACVSEAINQSGAWITDFHLYSNMLICINFEVSIANVGRLAEFLQKTGLHLSQESLEQLMPVKESTLKQKDLAGTLQITFIHNEPDLLREVPAVPG